MTVRKDTADFAKMDVKVTETVVWTRGRSQTFTSEELDRGDADSWMERVREKDTKKGSN